MGAAASDYFTPYTDVQYGFLDAELGILNFHALAAKGDFHRVSVCLKKGLDPNATAFDDDDDYAREDTPMICAARGVPLRRDRKRHVKTMEVLLHFGGDVNKWNYLEQTPLYVACEKNALRVAQWLVTHGADVNKGTKVGMSPLLCAYRNSNVAMVKLLLEHGAKAIDPPHNFSCIKFPTISKELRGENEDQQASSDSDSSSDDSTENAEPATAVARPISSRLLLRPLWKKATKAESLEPLEKTDATITGPTVAVAAATQPPTAEEIMRKEIEVYAQRQQQKRDELIGDLDEKKRIQEQREYREKLAVDNAKRKQRRQLKREKASYDKYIARVEQKRLEQLAPLQHLHDQGEVRPTTTGSLPNGTLRLRWNQQQDGDPAAARRRVQTAASRVGRPTWKPQELSAMQATSAQPSKAGGELDDDKMMQQCRKIFDTVQASRERREQLRTAYTAPTAAAKREQPETSDALKTTEQRELPQLTATATTVMTKRNRGRNKQSRRAEGGRPHAAPVSGMSPL